MPHLKILPALLLGMGCIASAVAQSSDWQAVKDIPPGTQISVTARHRFIHSLCIFQGASDEELVCEVNLHRRSPFTPSSIRYPRNDVRKVRLEHSDASNIASGVAIGAGIGVALGATAPNHSGSREGGAILLGGLGGLVGGVLGRDFPLFHGPVIYRSPDPQKH